jgi:LmbE family N-acetylglucosaminyl deacetylase
MSNTPYAGLKLLGVFAHPDDEVFCAGGTFAKYAAAGAEVMVVSATKGDAGQIRDAQTATRRTLGTVRERELLESCRRLGIQHCQCLDYGDGTLRELDSKVLTEHVTHIIRRFQPDIVITFGEDGAYGHPDHIAISVATTQACLASGSPERFPHQLNSGLETHSPSRLYHSHFPRSRMLLLNRLAHWLMEIQNNYTGTPDFGRALLLFAEETSLLHYSSDHIDVNWYPIGFFIIEQGEIAKDLYLILSGRAQAVREEEDGSLHVLADIGPGQFFGERGLALNQRRAAHVIAVENTTCLVFSSENPLAWLGRGAEAPVPIGAGTETLEDQLNFTTRIDVTDYVEQKVSAMAAHRTQYPISPDMFPPSMLREMLGQEYFIRVIPQREIETSLM